MRENGVNRPITHRGRIWRRIMMFSVLLGLCLGCASKDTSSDQSKSASPPEKKAPVPTLSLPDLFTHFEAKGLVIDSKDPKHGSLIGAVAGRSLRIGDGAVEVYQYNLSIETGVNALERLKKRGVAGKAAVVNGNLVLLEQPDHPQWAKIKATFLSLKAAEETQPSTE